MFYKILFQEPVEYDRLKEIEGTNGSLLQTQINYYTGSDSIIYSDSQIDLILNQNSDVIGLQICNECIKTYNIENHLLQLSYRLLDGSNSAEVIDSSGFSENLNKKNLEEYL